jgi:hypothetical protein
VGGLAAINISLLWSENKFNCCTYWRQLNSHSRYPANSSQPLVQLPESWHLLRFCHSNFHFKLVFSEIQMGIRLALLVLDTRMEGIVEGCGGNPNTRQ